MSNNAGFYILFAIRGILLLLITTIMIPVSPSFAAETCVVIDTTGTPLNVRETPNGAISNTLENGDVVDYLKTVVDDRGRPWSLVLTPENNNVGWVFRDYIDCSPARSRTTRTITETTIVKRTSIVVEY